MERTNENDRQAQKQALNNWALLQQGDVDFTPKVPEGLAELNPEQLNMLRNKEKRDKLTYFLLAFGIIAAFMLFGFFASLF